MAVQQRVNRSKKKQARPRRLFLAVDVWQKEFGPVSERAVRDVYARTFNVKIENMKKYSFHHCVNALRKHENPNYVAPNYGTAN